MKSELSHKLLKIRNLLKSAGKDAALISRQTNFAWLACGGEGHIAINFERAVGDLLVTQKKIYIIASQIEMRRLQEEVLMGLNAEPVLCNWFEDGSVAKALKKIVNPKRVISDTGDHGTLAQPDAFKSLRYSLHPAEVERFSKLCRDAERAVSQTCRVLKPGMTEFAIGGILSELCYDVGITPVVILVATDERIKNHRHPLPTFKKLKRHAMVVVCARRNGLIASVTRIVHFGKLPTELRRRHDLVCGVDAAFVLNTRIGMPVREIFARGMSAYAQAGFDGEWKLHHQGGPCGYEPRDYVGTPTATGTVLNNQAFAWNPSITGTKTEDTILATVKGPRILSASKEWPSVRVEHEGHSILRPDVLVR